MLLSHCIWGFLRGGNGTPLQYSRLENPRDGGAWWAAVYGVAQSRTRLKRLRSSSSSSSSMGLPQWLSGKESTCNAGDTGLISASRRSFGEGKSSPLQYSCLGNLMDKGAGRLQSAFATPWTVTVAHQAPLSVGLPRQEYWSGLLFPSPENLPDLGIKPPSLVSPELAGRFLYH